MKDITPYNIGKLISLIADAQKPVIVTHAKPDGDAIGSSSAMLHFIMQTCGKADAKLILNDDCPRYIGFIKGAIPANALIIRSLSTPARSSSDAIMSVEGYTEFPKLLVSVVIPVIRAREAFAGIFPASPDMTSVLMKI